MEKTTEKERMKHDAALKEMQFRAENEIERVRIDAKAKEDERKEAFGIKRLEAEHVMKLEEHKWTMQMEENKIKWEKEKEEARLETEKVMKYKELKINREIEDQKIKSKEDTAKYIEDRRSDTMVKVTEMKTSAIQGMETKRIEAATVADKDRKELLMAALTHVKDPEIMKLFLSSITMLGSSVFAPGLASESISKIQVRIDLPSAVTSEEEEDEKTDNEDEEERAWQS